MASADVIEADVRVAKTCTSNLQHMQTASAGSDLYPLRFVAATPSLPPHHSLENFDTATPNIQERVTIY